MEKFLKLIIAVFVCILFVQCEQTSFNNPEFKRIPIHDGLTVLFNENYVIDAYDEMATAYYWDDGNATYGKTKSNISEHKFQDTGLHHVVVYYLNDSSIYKVYCAESFLIYIPNSFSPDGSGPEENNIFKVECSGFTSFSLKLFDMDFVLLYESDDYFTHGWDGMIDNHTAAVGSYIYQLKLTDMKGGEHSFQGVFHIVL